MCKLRLILLAAAVFVLQGCGSSRVMVLEPAQKPTTPIRSVAIVSDMSTTEVPHKYQKKFEQVLSEKLYTKYGFEKGHGLEIHYRFLQLDEGSRFSRWMLGGIGNSGEGSLTVEARFIGEKGRELGKIHTEGKIGSGAFGGSFDCAVEKASESLAEYIVKNFK